MTVVWIASYPRSGNKFMRLLLESAGVETYSVYANKAWKEKPLPISIVEMHASTKLYALKTHETPMQDAYRSILIVRDGRDAVVSFAHLQTDETTLAANVKRKARFDQMVNNVASSWWSDMAAWRNRGPVVRFEDLIADPETVAGKLLSDLGVSGTVKAPSFTDLHAQRPNYFRSGQVGQWRQHMPKDIQRKFWEIHGPTMLSFGYTEN